MFVDVALVAETEAAVCLWSAATLMGMVWIQLGQRRRLRPRLQHAEQAVATWLVGNQEDTESVREALFRLPEPQRALLLMGLAARLEGDSQVAVQALAQSLGLTAWAQRSVKSRRWWIRLRGARYFSTLRLLPDNLERLLRDSHPQVRAEAVTLACSSSEPAAVEQAARELFGSASLSRFAAELSLPKARALATHALCRLLEEPPGDPRLALQVARAVADPSLLPAALRFSRDENTGTRVAAVELLGQLGGQEALGRVLELLDDPCPSVQAAAALALGQLNHWQAATRLAERVGAADWAVRRAAAAALKRFGPPGELFLRRLAGAEEEPARGMATYALAAPELA